MTDTIAAIATALGPAGVGIIRLSGTAALATADRLASGVADQDDRRLVLRRLAHPATRAPLDHGLVCVMRGPHSFTGEDVVELHVHGGRLNLNRLLDALLSAGARRAEPGEFTRRAVLNGRLDLTQAEALIDIVEARSESALELAHRQRTGALSSAVGALAARIESLLVVLEASLDFPEEDDVRVMADQGDELAAIEGDLQALAGTFDAGRAIREGFRVVLAGPTNAGKSTLFNALLGADRAIVTARPGTTRDYLEERATIGGVPVVLVDTAGLRTTEDEVESEGVARARDQVVHADLVLAVCDGSVPLDEDTERWLATLGEDAIEVHAKDDLRSRRGDIAPALSVSAVTGEGMDVLRAAIGDRLGGIEHPNLAERVFVTRRRHREALERAVEALSRARGAAAADRLAADLHSARRALDELVGACPPEEILGRIFAEFCIGK